MRYLPEEKLWLYFGFVTDFMLPATPEQLEQALELNLFGRGTADFHLGLIGKALALSGNLPADTAEPDRLVEHLMQLAQHLTPLHRTLTATDSTPLPEGEANASEAEPDLPVKSADATAPQPVPAESDPFSFLNNDLLRV